jgi:hypothetical protein
LKTKNISVKTKLKIFNSNVKSTLLYGSETWKTITHILNKLQTLSLSLSLSLSLCLQAEEIVFLKLSMSMKPVICVGG